jgi:hypothetical protein
MNKVSISDRTWSRSEIFESCRPMSDRDCRQSITWIRLSRARQVDRVWHIHCRVRLFVRLTQATFLNLTVQVGGVAGLSMCPGVVGGRIGDRWRPKG